MTDGLRLVDYDALFVPALLGKGSLELGHPSYQHPDGNAHHYDKNVDNFSAWLIHSAILAIAVDPALYIKHCNGDDSLLFRRADLADPEKSQLFAELLSHPSEHIRNATQLINRMLWAEPHAFPMLGCSEEVLQRLPQFKPEPKATVGDSSARDAARLEQLNAQVSNCIDLRCSENSEGTGSANSERARKQRRYARRGSSEF